jgi:hypothetical protein
LYSGFTVKDALDRAGEPPKLDYPFHEGEPPVDFFTNIPKEAAAVFSTVDGTRPFRMVENSTYERPGHYWWAAEVQRVSDELRRNLPEACKTLQAPQTYHDLYQYFVAYDIYHRGAQNLWNVIHHLIFENQYVNEVVQKEQMIQQSMEQIPLFESLALEVLKKPEMQTKLVLWDKEKQQDVLKVFNPYDLQLFEGYKNYDEYFLQVLRPIFERHYESLRQGTPLIPLIPATHGHTFVGQSQSGKSRIEPDYQLFLLTNRR